MMILVVFLVLLGVFGFWFCQGLGSGLCDYDAVDYLIKHPSDEWPHMPLAAELEAIRLVDLINKGLVYPVALLRFLEARPSVLKVVRHRALIKTLIND